MCYRLFIYGCCKVPIRVSVVLHFLKKGIESMAKKKKASKKEILVVGSKVKGYIRGKKMMCSADAIAALSDKVHCILDAAICRTKANKRSTVKPQDL